MKLLLVDDCAGDMVLLEHALGDSMGDVCRATTLSGAREHLATTEFDAVVTDHSMACPEGSFPAQELAGLHPGEVITWTGSPDAVPRTYGRVIDKAAGVGCLVRTLATAHSSTIEDLAGPSAKVVRKLATRWLR
jgi:hypothetical protein